MWIMWQIFRRRDYSHEKLKRDYALKRLHGMGLSIGQLERLIRVVRGIIQLAVNRALMSASVSPNMQELKTNVVNSFIIVGAE